MSSLKVFKDKSVTKLCILHGVLYLNLFQNLCVKSPDEFLVKLKYHLNHILSDAPNISRVSLVAMNKYNVRETKALLQDKLAILYIANSP